ncbi:hypothetical protein, partial [Selenomonas noxia]|uniref:hypothetical protein n=1 Tax=Selenomonas noxia TaxID=135083 RepID=UPI0028D5EEB0
MEILEKASNIYCFLMNLYYIYHRRFRSIIYQGGKHNEKARIGTADHSMGDAWDLHGAAGSCF